ncbi:Uncharacterised protein [uncultured archaeon]|nr:Uncharacterised protein [uncultured archaeon]
MNLLLTLDAGRVARARSLVFQQPFHLGLDFHGVTAILATNYLNLVEHVRLGYGHFEAPPVEKPDITLLVLEAGQERFEASFSFLLPGRVAQDNVIVPLEGNLIFLLRDIPSTAYYTTMNLFGGVMARLRPRYICLHAASVSSEDRAAILVGAAHCGKTSLTTNLISQGFNYSSDDVTLLEHKTLRIAAFPRAINVREEDQELDSALLAGARRVGRFEIADQKRLMVDLGLPVPESVAPRIVCFPRYRQGQPAEFRLLDKADAFVGLMQNRFHLIGDRQDSEIGKDFDAFSRLTEQCACYRLLFSDPMAASRLIAEQLIEDFE